MDQDNLILIAPRTPRADSVKNRRLLLDTARRLFDEQGVDAVCMSAIADAAGVGKGTLYRHFTNKTELCQALLDDDQRDLQERTLQQMRLGGSPAMHLRWFLPEVAAFVERNRALLHVSVPSVNENALAYPAHLWWRQTIRGLLQAMHASGDLDYLSDVLYVMLDVQTIHFQRTHGGYSFERIINNLLDTLDRLTV
ncbi:MAG: helix-turn-helix domain-containing protein [Anaerolineae bacterium]